MSWRKKFHNSIACKFVTLMMAAMAAMVFVSLLMIKLIEFSYRGYVYESKSDLLRTSIRSVERELEKIEHTTYQFLTDPEIQSCISQWLAAQKHLEEGDASLEQFDREWQKNKTDSMRALRQKLDPLITASRSISTGFFLSPEGIRYNGYDGGRLLVSEDRLNEMVAKAREREGDPVYLVHPGGQLMIARAVREKKNLTMNYGGTLVLEIDLKRLADSDSALSQQLLILAQDQTVMVSSLTPEEEAEFLKQEFALSAVPYKMIFLNGTKRFVTGLASEKLDWRYYSISSYQELFGLMEKADCIYIALFAILAILIAATAVRFSVYLVSPVVELSGQIRRIRDKNHIADNLRTEVSGEQVEVDREDEIGELQRQFQQMVQELDTLIHENYEQKIYLQQAQIAALRTQLNPHFLYNTLDLIRWMASPHRYRQIPSVVRALGDVLRLAMNSKKTRIAIGEEVDYLRSYVSIQKTRFGSRLNMELEIPEELMEFQIPAFSLQPLVENSIHYGMEQMLSPCCIQVKIMEEGEFLLCTVEDNGPGMDTEILKKLRAGTEKAQGNGIGLINLDNRLKGLYGSEFGLWVEKSKGGGARVCFRVRKERRNETCES